MIKDFRLSRRNGSSNGNNENTPLDPSETLNRITDPDPLRPPFNPIQDPTPISRRKPESVVTPSKNVSFRTPEKSAPSVSKNRFGWAPADNSEETSYNMSTHLPPLSRYGTGACTVTPRTFKVTSGKASSLHSESNSTHSTPSKSVTKPSYGLSGSRPPLSAGTRSGLVKVLPSFAGPVTVVDTPQVPHFELREDPSFWLDHNVQVVIRVRPLNSTEKNLCGFNRCLKQESSQTITWIGQPETRFMFDYVACETINQEMLFRVAGLPMVENCMSGYNSCMFAYGQTGSGKTHTMLGEISDLDVRPSPDRGMTPRIFEFLFARIRAEEESRRDEKLRYNCKCSFLEIYNEQITDLLDPSSTNLLLREDVQKGVYVENLTEFKVDSVHDILSLIIQGSANRRVAATNMNRESSRSHSVFTCVIESHWEKDNTTNFRFARLNLVDLAGSERQKTSGAEGERLKEAASINKSLSTLGHVIMVLSNLANGKQKHVPYRDSRLTFLLQDSLGGNSKTMIIANVSPSMCSASETLSTLKFSQRARLIQNNAMVNEDTSGDVLALQRQIRLLKEEVALLKRQTAQRATLLHMDNSGDSDDKISDTSSVEKMEDVAGPANGHKRLSTGFSKSIRLSDKQWKSLEATLAGALRRERVSETTIKQLEAEIEQLNRLVRQREEDTRCTKMMLKFREDKINRMEALVKGEISPDLYVVEDNKVLTKEIELLRTRVDRNPEVTRFALENIRLLDQIRRYQDFYEEGERDLLTNEVSQLRNQLMHLLDGKPELEQLHKLATENQELEHLTKLDANAGSFSTELKRTSEELERCRNDLQACLDVNKNLRREIMDLKTKLGSTKYGNDNEPNEEIEPKNCEEVLNLQLELDILKVILEEEKSAHLQNGERTTELETELKNAKSVIESLESQFIILMKELEEVRERNISKKTEPRRLSLKQLEKEDSPLNIKLKKMQASIDMARSFKHVPESPVERERDEVRKQAEVATAEVIVCLQEELAASEQRVEELEAEQVELRAHLDALGRVKEESEREWEVLAHEIASVLSDGNTALEAAFDDIGTISGGFSQKDWVSAQIGNLARGICERDELIEELNNCLEDAQRVSCDLEWKLRSLRGATLAITEAHQQENREKEIEISMLEEEMSRIYLEKEVLLGFFPSIQVEVQKVKLLNVELQKKENKMGIAMSEILGDVLKARFVLEEFKAAAGETHGSKPLLTSDKLIDDVIVTSDEILQRSSLIKREIKDLIYSLHEVRDLMDVKGKTLLHQMQSLGTMKDLQTEVLQLETDFRDKEREFQVRMLEMEKKMLELQKVVAAANSSWHETREDLELELRETRALATQKSLEASNLLEKIEETQETILVADATVNALMHANEGLKVQVGNHQQAERLLLNQVQSLTTSLEVMNREFKLISDFVTELEKGFRHVQSSVSQKLELVSSDINQVKLGFKHDVSMARELLEGTWLEIIRKDCALSVLNLCQMGILLERVTGLTAENSFLQKGINASNSLISSLRENNLKAKTELELCSVIKGKLLADITKSFNRISKKEEETQEMKLRVNFFELKIQELQLREEKMLEKSSAMHEELRNLVREIESNQQHDLEASLWEKELILQQLGQLTRERNVLSGVVEDVGMEATLRLVDWQLSLLENEMLRDELREFKKNEELVSLQISKIKNESDILCRVSEEMVMHATLQMVDVQLSLHENMMLEEELQKSRRNHETLLNENSNLRDAIKSSDLFIITMQQDVHSKIRAIDSLKSELLAVQTSREIATVDGHLQRIFHSIDQNIDLVSYKVNKDFIEQMNTVSKFSCELEVLEQMLEKLKGQNSYLLSELSRREQLSEGLLFDLRLLQESASAAKEEKEEEISELTNAVEVLKSELEDRNGEIEALLSEIGEKDHIMESLECEISELKSRLESLNGGTKELEDKLCEKNWVVAKLEEELLATSNLIREKSFCIEELSGHLTQLTGELTMANALAAENEAVATEARQIAEERKAYAEEKEEEVKLLENSIQELEATICALESKVDMVREEADKQQVQRELLEAELHQVRKQLGDTCGGDVKNQIVELKKNIEILEKELANKEAEVAQCKGHISELNMHAEAQAREYKQKFRELEAMAQQVKSIKSTAAAGPVGSTNQTKNKGTGSPFKGRGSGSPFKCIGLGIIQQMNSEKDEDITALKRQIDELETLASSRQKEIFMLNTRLAAAESMTHDVIRDLLGVKMDMTSYASTLDNCQKIPLKEMDFVSGEETEEKEQEIKKLKMRLSEFIEERQGWIDEINQRQTEILAARVTAEKLRQREQLLLTENGMLKCENENYKNKVVQLEDEMQRIPTQHTLHLRIHHHAKTKEENNILRKENENLYAKLEKTESILKHVKEELGRYRASSGRDPYFNIEDEEQLRRNLQESEDNRLQLAERLMEMCTSVLKVAGFTDREVNLSPDAAKAALDCIQDRITSLEAEVQDLKLKCKLQSEKERLAELRWGSSPLRPKFKEMHNSPSKASGSASISISR
ncbi:phragmoplast-associated kinesin-related protein [Rhynchospora pubera]|uniref:Phragmoplast-associated kinesin-related protein n=1 Tax=Rhynchospora pubera TaxID=906938 RepID=A0AAV8GKJ7_9POAL|nr:phragmoplast-associated kinesin-related protein [Rhynchospora pubera]